MRQSISSSFLGYLGYSLHTESGNQPYIESDIQAVPFPDPLNTTSSQTVNGSYYASLQFIVDPKLVIRKEIEQRSKSLTGYYGWNLEFHGYGMIYPWGLVQRLGPFKEKYKEKLSSLDVELQSDDPDIKETFNTKEYEISSIRKQLNDFEKRLKFYENIVDTSILISNETGASPTTGN
ncbi:10788_t:CDS:2, partial [Racocetra persica]